MPLVSPEKPVCASFDVAVSTVRGTIVTAHPAAITHAAIVISESLLMFRSSGPVAVPARAHVQRVRDWGSSFVVVRNGGTRGPWGTRNDYTKATGEQGSFAGS